MRVRRALTAGLVALVGSLATAMLATPAHAATFGTVNLDPQFGPGNATINAEFQWSGAFGAACPRFNVIFKWDGRQVGANKLDNCVADATFRPPKDDRKPGPHKVNAPDDKGRILGGNVFVIENPAPSGSPSPSVSPSPSRSKGTKPTPTDSAIDPATDPALPTYAGPSLDGTVAAAAGTDNRGGGASGGGTSPIRIALGFGGALVLGGVVILGYIVQRGRRAASGSPPAAA